MEAIIAEANRYRQVDMNRTGTKRQVWQFTGDDGVIFV
jgi:hypothetical protein